MVEASGKCIETMTVLGATVRIWDGSLPRGEDERDDRLAKLTKLSENAKNK